MTKHDPAYALHFPPPVTQADPKPKANPPGLPSVQEAAGRMPAAVTPSSCIGCGMAVPRFARPAPSVSALGIAATTARRQSLSTPARTIWLPGGEGKEGGMELAVSHCRCRDGEYQCRQQEDNRRRDAEGGVDATECYLRSPCSQEPAGNAKQKQIDSSCSCHPRCPRLAASTMKRFTCNADLPREGRQAYCHLASQWQMHPCPSPPSATVGDPRY